MNFNPFGTVNDYPSMLNKVSMSVFVLAVALTLIIRKQILSIDTYLSAFNFPIPIGSGLSFPLGTILPAFVIAVISRIFKLHDRVSDVIGIRQRFDLHTILYPMAIATTSKLAIPKIKKIKDNRFELMKDVFYKYASSTQGKAVIDSHYITIALDQWSWYWIVIEGATLSILSALILLLNGDGTSAAFILLVVTIGCVIILPSIQKLCEKYALDEVDAILSDAERRKEIEQVFRAL